MPFGLETRKVNDTLMNQNMYKLTHGYYLGGHRYASCTNGKTVL